MYCMYITWSLRTEGYLLIHVKELNDNTIKKNPGWKLSENKHEINLLDRTATCMQLEGEDHYYGLHFYRASTTEGKRVFQPRNCRKGSCCIIQNILCDGDTWEALLTKLKSGLKM